MVRPIADRCKQSALSRERVWRYNPPRPGRGRIAAGTPEPADCGVPQERRRRQHLGGNLNSRMIVTALVLAGPLAAGAQGHPYAPLILQRPGSTRALAMGNANVGGRDDDVLFYNPAQLFVARGTSVSEQWYSGADMLTTISTSGLTLGPGIIGLGVQSLAFRSDLGTPDPSQLGRSRFFPASGLVLATGYSQRLFGTRLGVVAKLVDQQIGTLRDRRGAYDAGIARDMLRGTFGLSVQNIGEAMRTGPTPLVPLGITSERVPMPTRATFGYQMSGLPVGQFDIAASSAVRSEERRVGK